MTFDNNNSLKPTRKEEGVTQSGLIEKKVKDIEDQIDDIKERLTPLENTVEGFENEVNTDSVVAGQVHSGHDYTDELSVSGDADVQGTISAAKVTAADVEVSNKVKTKDAQVTNNLTVEGTGTFAEVSAESFDIETFNADELNAVEFSSDNADITNLASDSITADAANIKAVTSETVTTENITVSDTVTAKDADLSGDLSADDVTASNVKVSDTADVLKLMAETMQSGRLFIAPEQMFLIPENGWIHFHNVNAGRFILYLTDFTDTTTNIHSLGNVKFSAVIDYVNNSGKGAVKVLYVQPELKSFEAVYLADNGEIWFKRSSQYLNARRAVVFAESEKELIVDTFAENAQTFDVSEAKSITLRNFNNDVEIVKEKFLKGDYTIDGNIRITGYLTPGQVISERALFLGYSDYVTADSDGILSAKGAVIDGNLSVINDATISGDNTVTGDETIGGTLSVTGNTDLDADLNVDGETTLNDDVTLGEDLSVSGNTLLHETQINGELTVDADINAAASVHIDKDVSIKGDLYVQGVTYQTEERNVSTTGDFIVTRDNNNTPLGSGEYSGLAVNNYDTGKIATLTADSNGEWRVSDSATATAQTYTNVSEFNGGWFSGITQTAITALKGIFTNISGDELADVVLYNGSDYYHFDGETWYGTVSVSNGKLVKGNAVTDAALITALEVLTKHTLVYYASVTVKEIDASTNQPLLTREERSSLNNNDILVWNAVNGKAVHAVRPVNNGDVLTANIDSQTGEVSYSWDGPQSIFDIVHPIGEVYTQYPGCKTPSSLYNLNGISSTWSILDYGNAFFRASNQFTTLNRWEVLNNNSIVMDTNPNLVEGQLLYDPVTNTTVTVSNIDTSTPNVWEINFTPAIPTLTNDHPLYVGQKEGTAVNGLGTSTDNTYGRWQYVEGDPASKNLIYKYNSDTTFDPTGNFFGGRSTAGGSSRPPSGIFSSNGTVSDTYDSGGSPAYYVHADVRHRHRIYYKSNDIETRPVNFTKIIWKRIN